MAAASPPPPISPRGVSPSPGARDATVDLEDFLGTAGSSAKYCRAKLIGKGSFGQAWLVKRASDKKLLVAKEMDMSAMSARDVQYVRAEVECLAACKHFAIVGFHESVAVGHKMIIVMEFADAGDLNMQIKDRASDPNNQRYFEEHEVGYTLVQLCLALEHVHSLRMLHRDIKGANVMLMSNGLVKLGDFGFSHKYTDTVSMDVAGTFCGTPYYLPPEMWRRQLYSKKADVWSLGVLLFEMMSLKRPFIGAGMSGLKEAVLKMNWSMQLPSKFSRELQDVCALILNPDPIARPSIQQVLAHPYLKRLLSDFERSVAASPLIDDETKKQIAKDIQDAAAERTRSEAAAAAASADPASSATGNAVEYEGAIRKDSGGVWKERYFVLKDGQLTITVKKGDAESKSLAVAFLASAVPVPAQTAKAEGVFALYTRDKKSMWMQAPSNEEALMWVHKVQQAMGVV